MKWKKFTLKTTTEAVDYISSLFDEIGIQGIEIEDNVPLTESETKGMFIDILPELPPDDGTARVSFYLDDDDDAEAILKEVDEGLSELRQYVEIGEGTITASETEDKDWINNWKQYFKPFTVDHILIKPTWEEIPEEHKDKLLIQIDPGTAFGTGKHETTQLCIRQLEKYVKPGVRILDLGTGSGILGITALKLGAGSVFGTDLDENAITAVHENLEANGIPEEKFGVVQGNIIDEKEVQDAAGYECYDIAVANILADVIIMIQKEVPVHLKQGGIFITSGIIDMKEQGFRITYLPVDQDGIVSLDALREAICDDTILVSIMYVNNEMGAVEPVAEIGKLIKSIRPDIYFHVDAIQAYGKYVIRPKKEGIDLMSVSGHKIHGPKGVGFLYVDEKVRIKPIIFGGGQQKGMRSGTENVPGCAGLGMAVREIYKDHDERVERLYALKDRLVQGLSSLEGVTVHGRTGRDSAPQIVSAGFEGVRAEVLLHALEDRGIYVSSGSACSSNHPGVSGTLRGIGVRESLLDSTLRFSFGVFNTEDEVDYCLEVLRELLPVLRRYRRA